MAQNRNVQPTEYLLTDSLGSIRQVIGSTGYVLVSQSFDPFGSPFEHSVGNWASQSKFGWTGQQSDANGLVYLRARYYQPGAGRFTQLDPSGAERNGYQYAGSSPTMHGDPSGLCYGWLSPMRTMLSSDICNNVDAANNILGNPNTTLLQKFGAFEYIAVTGTGVGSGITGLLALAAEGISAVLPGITGQVLGQAAAWETLGGEAFLEFGVTALPHLATAGYVAENLFYAYGISLGIRKLTGLGTPSDQEMMDWAFAYQTGLQLQIGPAIAQARAATRASNLTANFYVTEGGTAIPRSVVAEYGFDASVKLADALTGVRLASEQELLYEMLARMRYINRPKGTALDQAFIDDFARYLNTRGVGRGALRDGVIAILEAEGRWYAGFSGMPQGANSLESSISAHFARITNQPPAYYGNFHAETNALSEYAVFSSASRGMRASMAVNYRPCTYCIPWGRPLGGNMWAAAQAAHISQLEIVSPTAYWRLPWYTP